MTQRRSEKLTVAAEETGERLDRVLAQRVAELSRSRHKALILAGRVAIDGATIRDPGHRVNAGESIMLDRRGLERRHQTIRLRDSHSNPASVARFRRRRPGSCERNAAI